VRAVATPFVKQLHRLFRLWRLFSPSSTDFNHTVEKPICRGYGLVNMTFAALGDVRPEDKVLTERSPSRLSWICHIQRTTWHAVWDRRPSRREP
jgi:hypothetical protein